MMSKIIRSLIWVCVLCLIWLCYLFYNILDFPDGNLSDSADVAIVLGAAAYDDKPSPVFAERINHAVNLYHKGKVGKLIFTGGSADKQQKAESVVARKYAIDKNIKANDIFIETSSLTTLENLVNAKQILDRERLKSAVIISDGLHLKRAMLMTRHLNIEAKPSATPTSLYRSLKTRLPFAFRELYFYHHYLLLSE